MACENWRPAGSHHDLCDPRCHAVFAVKKSAAGYGLDMGSLTLTSQKHGILNWKLAQASTFQSIMKRTRKCQVDVEALQSELTTLFGHRVDSAFCAYRPKFERVPLEAHTSSSYRCVATLSRAGALSISDWQERSAGKRPFESPGACIFALCRRLPSTDQGIAPQGDSPDKFPHDKDKPAKPVAPAEEASPLLEECDLLSELSQPSPALPGSCMRSLRRFNGPV